MVQSSSINFISLVILCIAPGVVKSDYFIKNGDARGKFVKLLKTIANANEQRLHALKKVVALDDIKVASGYLRDTDGQKGPIIAVILKNMNADGLQFKTDDKSIGKHAKFQDYIQLTEDDNHYEDDDDDEEIKLEELPQDLKNLIKEHEGDEKSSDVPSVKLNHGTEINKVPSVSEFEPKDILRWSCIKNARKDCKKACNAAYKEVCSSYKCSRSMKRSFKRNCKGECREKFY